MYQVIMTRGTMREVFGSYEKFEVAQKIAQDQRGSGYWESVVIK